MNKKAKALISTIILISLICFIFLVLIKPSLSASEKFTVQFDIVPSIAHQTLYITITNNQDITDNLDLKTIINETNFNTQQIRNAQFYELKNVDYTITDYKTVCNPYNEVTANGTIEYPNCTQVVSGSHIETRQEWKQRQLTSNQAADKEVKHQWEQIAIGKTPNNIKKFKLEFDTPIVRNGAGWGSAGTIYLAMNGKAYVDKSHSSWWNESWTYRQKIIFNKVNWSSANLINFTTLILITNTTNGTSFNWSQRDAIRFIDANDSMELNHSVDNWNSTSQQAYIYVLVPEINNSGNDFIYLYYGNPTATNIEGNASVATNRYRFENNANDVYNLENWTEGTTPLYSTSNVKEGTHSINFSHNDTNALRHNTFFDNVNTKYGATGITFAAWYNFHNLTAANPSLFRWLFVQTDKLGQNYIMITSGDDTGAPLVDNKLFFHIGAGANGIMSIDVNTSIWYYLSLNWHPNGTAYVYRDGLLVNTSTVNTQIISDGTEWDNWIGRYAVDGRAADGQMDDLRFYGRALNADETNATYQSLENNFVTFGQEEFYDAEPPKWSNPKTNATNETKTQQSVYFNVTLNDNIGGGYQIFSFYNGTSWINDSAETWIAPQELEEKRTITATRGMVVKWYWWFNDSVGLFNQTPEWQFTVANTAPTQTKPLLTSTSGKNLNNDNLTCYNQSTYDADNDAVINIFNWYLNSQSFAVLNMPFETSAKDYSGYGNDGIIYGTTFEASKTIGKVGNALSFDGTDDYVSYTGSPLLKDMKNISISGWMYAKSVPTTGEGLFSSTNLAYGCTYYIDGRVWCYINGGGNNVVTPVATNEWHYITETYDGNTIRLYVDGVEKSTRAFNGSTGTSSEFRVGAFSGYFNGTIDEVKVYNKTLTPQQIKQLYEETKDGLTSNSTIVAEETTPGEIYQCEVTPNDGFDDGLTNSSDPLTVLWAITFNVTSGE